MMIINDRKSQQQKYCGSVVIHRGELCEKKISSEPQINKYKRIFGTDYVLKITILKTKDQSQYFARFCTFTFTYLHDLPSTSRHIQTVVDHIVEVWESCLLIEYHRRYFKHVSQSIVENAMCCLPVSACPATLLENTTIFYTIHLCRESRQ